jgi:hypothetical protein
MGEEEDLRNTIAESFHLVGLYLSLKPSASNQRFTELIISISS